ncbi:Transcription factor Adf-1 [Gryllus bimaculatus]|nr:Transcription factor Adf-1 [Gryllus bimaculatus]
MPRQSQYFEKDQDEHLIKLVSEYPALYDPRHVNYKESDKRETIWVEISEKLLVDVDLCKKRWKYFRDTYVKFKKNCFKNSGERTNKKSKFMYEDAMSFLWPFVFNRQNAEGITPDHELSCCYPSDGETEKVGCESLTDSHNLIIRSKKQENGGNNKTVSPAHSTESGYRTNTCSGVPEDHEFQTRAVKSEPLEVMSLKPNQSPSEENSTEDEESANDISNEIHEVHPIKSFFDAMAATVMTLPPHMQLIVKSQVFQVVTNAEHHALSSASIPYFNQALHSALVSQAIKTNVARDENKTCSAEGT